MLKSLMRCYQTTSSQLSYQATAEIPLTKTQHLPIPILLTSIAIMSGNYFNNWPVPACVDFEQPESLNYYADMYAANSPHYRGPAPVAFSVHSAGQRRWGPALYAVPPGHFDLPALTEEQVSARAYLAGQEQRYPAPNAASQQFGGPQMVPAHLVAAPAIFTGQVNMNSAPFAGQAYSVAGSQFSAPQVASHRSWTPATHAASPVQMGQNMYTARRVATPAPAPRAVNAHRAYSAVPAYMLPQSRGAAPQAPIDLTGDGNSVAPSTPAPQRAGTKRARADSTSGTAPPKVKKARVEKPKSPPREKKEPKKKAGALLNSGLRLPTVAAATSAPNNNSVPFQGETPAVEQPQQQQQPSMAAAIEPTYIAADTTLAAPEMARIDSADPRCEGKQPQPQQDPSADVPGQFYSKAADTSFEVQETPDVSFVDERPVEERLEEAFASGFLD
jgi:hypothetical protein